MNGASLINHASRRLLLPALLVMSAIFPLTSSIAGQQREKQLAGYSYKQVVVNADSSAAGLPLVIGLHWSGSTPEEFEKYLAGLKSPARLVLVEASHPHKSGFSFFRRQPQDYYRLPEDEKMAALLAEGEKMSRFIAEATALYRPKIKPVVIGASQGGDLSYVIGARYNHLISLSCPLLATMDDRIVGSSTLENPAPIEIFHGTADPIVPLAAAQRHAAALKKNGFSVKLRTYQNIGHDISDAMRADYVKLIDRRISSSRK
jgi:phospholipase/carboxylesterase